MSSANIDKTEVKHDKPALAITFEDVKKYLCPKASDAEIGLFLKVCQSEGLNPFKKECFLVKYSDDQPAAIIISTEAYLKAAESCPEFDGIEAGIILRDSAGKLEFREGSFLLDEEHSKLVGGWAKVYRKDRSKPTYAAVNIKECIKYTSTGKPTRFWQDMPATMVRKVALSRALREAFPSRLGGLLTTAEFEEIQEGDLPPALQKPSHEPDWHKFWAKVKNQLGITEEDVKRLLQVQSIKELLNQGWTIEQVWDELVKRFDESIKETAKQAATSVTPKRDPETIKTIADLYKACFDDFKMQPKDVLKELGYKTQTDIAETPADCYRRIVAIKWSPGAIGQKTK